MAESETLRVLLATPWDTACGIAEHSAMLKAAVEAADPQIEIVPEPAALDPFTRAEVPGPIDLLHLNYHAALHSRWSAGAINLWRTSHGGTPVVVTYHDTGVPNSDQCKAVCDAADAVVVHEPCDDLPAEKTHYWRMGVSDGAVPDQSQHAWAAGLGQRSRPYLGTVGFPFPWKCYDELCRVTAANGWGIMLLAPNATPEDVARWRAINPYLVGGTGFAPRETVVGLLATCDATAFCYVTHNTGQSGAILQGIAARKPVIALRTCRQMRALALDPLGAETICWAETFEDVGGYLRHLPLGRLDAGIVALAEQESWRHVGAKYAALYRQVMEARV